MKKIKSNFSKKFSFKMDWLDRLLDCSTTTYLKWKPQAIPSSSQHSKAQHPTNHKNWDCNPSHLTSVFLTTLKLKQWKI